MVAPPSRRNRHKHCAFAVCSEIIIRTKPSQSKPLVIPSALYHLCREERTTAATPAHYTQAPGWSMHHRPAQNMGTKGSQGRSTSCAHQTLARLPVQPNLNHDSLSLLAYARRQIAAQSSCAAPSQRTNPQHTWYSWVTQLCHFLELGPKGIKSAAQGD